MKNIKNLWSIICRSSSIDLDTNIMSLLDVIEEITITSSLDSGTVKDGQMLQLPLEFVTMWQREGGLEKELSANINLVSIGPNGKKTESGPLKLAFEKGKPRVRLRIKSPGVVFNGFGSYKFKVMLEEKEKFVEVQEIPLEIKSSIKV
jgi:hypothetical protein